MRAHSRPAGHVARLFDTHGATLHDVAGVLTDDAAHAETLVVTAFTTPPPSKTLRQLAAAVYTAWVCRPAPLSSTGPVGDVSCLPLLAALHQLPDDHRAALALCAFGDHTYGQAAETVGVPAADVARLLHEVLEILGDPSASGLAS